MTASTRISKSTRRIVLASFLGSTFEWYDFNLYGTTSALVFNQVFFPASDAAVGTLLALATTAVGFFTRPIGGIVFGHFGDRVGRRTLLVITMLTMGIPTVLIGLLPGYGLLGAAAPVTLLILRLIQGIGLGGEYAGAALATIESVPVEQRGRYGAIPQIGNPVGGVLSSVLVLLFSAALPAGAFAAWGWRVPFLVSAVLLVYALVVRLRLVETGDFERLRRDDQVVKTPLFTVLRFHWAPLLLGLGARAADAISGNVAGTVVIAYVVTYLRLSNSISLASTIIPALLAIPLSLVMGRVADRVGRKRIFVIGLVAVAVAVFPMFALLDTEIFGLMVLGVTIFRLCNTTQFSVQSAFLADIFPTEVRYTAISLVYQVSAIIGGLTPPVALAILIGTGGSPWLLAAILVVVFLLSACCALAMRSRLRSDLTVLPGSAA